jgi:hypothetical protein
MIMRFQQLVLEEGAAEVALSFHPRLTVIAGLGGQERDGIIDELLGIMAGVGRNSRLDLVDDAGRHLAVRRADAPERDKVLNNDTAHEVSLEFLNAGRIDLLHALGLNLAQARRRCRLSPSDMTAGSRGDTLVASLATRNQKQLWAAAERVRMAEIRLASETEPILVTADDVTTMEEIERCHAALEAAQGRPFASRRKIEKARRAEHDALAAAGATSYVAFHMQRIADRLDRHDDRPSLKAADAERREATAAWQAIAGGISADWAFGMKARITIAADRLAAGGPQPTLPNLTGTDDGQPSPAELAEALMVRLADLRHVGPDGESLPLILDEPLVGIDLPVKQWMLELVGRAAGSPQVVYLTGDPDVAAWARIEALAGQLSVLESQPAHLDVDQT